MCKKCKQIRWNLVCIPLIFSPILLFFDLFKNYIYIPVIMFIASFVLFWNIPYVIFYTASKPLYYEDLFIDEKKIPNYNVDIKIKKKFELILKWVLIISNALLVSALCEFWFYKVREINSYIEIAGITGGIVKIFQIINNTITRIMLKILRRFIKSESNHNNVSTMTELDVVIKNKERSDTI
tara:strand:+ start:205 stop:750 length:546 start_codon:yes stop_codon:yes gene_type:complete